MKEKPTMVVVPIEDWEEYQRMKNQSEERDFVKGRDYVHSLGAIMIDIKSNNPSIENGFDSIEGGFCRLNVYNRKDWREAIEEEVIEAFESECVRRLGEDWREAKLKTHASGERIALNIVNHIPLIEKDDYNGWTVWNENGCVYSDGKWAEKLEEPKFAENLEDIDRLWYLSTFGHIIKVVGNVDQDKNHLPTEELTEGLLALIQLLSFRHDVWEKEGNPVNGDENYSIGYDFREKEFGIAQYEGLFCFKTKETAEWFLENHKDLLIEYFNKLVR